METIKSYTDLEQSKKLAKILPIESADMVWSSVFYEGIPSNGDEKLINAYLDPKTNHFYFAELYEEFVYNDNNTKEYPSIPCWSLAALVELMPKSIIDEYESKGWLGMCFLYYSSWRWIVYYSNEDIDSPALHEERGNTLMDAAYNMVCWLVEQGFIKK